MTDAPTSPYDDIAGMYHMLWADWYFPAAKPGLEKLFGLIPLHMMTMYYVVAAIFLLGFALLLEQEGQLQAAIDHPHIVTVYEAGESDHTKRRTSLDADEKIDAGGEDGLKQVPAVTRWR